MFPHPKVTGPLREVAETILRQYGYSVILIPAEVDQVALMIEAYARLRLTPAAPDPAILAQFSDEQIHDEAVRRRYQFEVPQLERVTKEMLADGTTELQVGELAQSVLEKYFPELKGQVIFVVEKGEGDRVSGRARFGLQEVVIQYGDGRMLGTRYRWALVPLVAHELAHFINPIDPDSVLLQRLPIPMVELWEALMKECSIEKEI